MLWLICVTINIQNVVRCRHGDDCATGQCHRQ